MSIALILIGILFLASGGILGLAIGLTLIVAGFLP